jgi:gentisate 1,2-dioxygenase
MAATIQTPLSKSFERPDETRTFPNGKLEIVDLDGTPMGRATFMPGWRWSESIKPVANTHSCQVSHLGFVMSGRMTIVMDDGTRLNFAAGDAMAIPAGHDAWVEGNEPCVVIDFVGFENFAKAQTSG